MDHATKQRIGSLLPKLKELLGDEYKLQSKVRNDVSSLEEGLGRIQIALSDADGEDEQTKKWTREVMELTYDIEPVVDKFRAGQLRAADPLAADPKGCITNMSFKGACSHLAATSRPSRKKLGKDISAIKDRAEKLADTNVANVDVPRHAGELVGLAAQVNKLVNILTEEGSTPAPKRQPKVASIVGPAGVGRTALAKEVYDRLAQKKDVSCAAWVTVSAEADIKKALWALLCQISEQEEAKFGSINVEETIDEIREALKDKRYLIVVDNIRSRRAWDTIRRAFIENSKSSAVLTTASCKVGDADDVVCELEPLSEKKFRRLSFRRTLGSEDSDGRRRVLGLSNTNLRPHLRSCLLYVSMFEMGSKVSVDRLVWGWIAEGFIPEQDGVTLRETGQRYLSEFRNGNLIEAVEAIGGDKALSCRVRDERVHDSIVSASAQENFATIVDKRQGGAFPETVHRRLSIRGNIPLPAQVQLSHVRSLVVTGDAKLFFQQTGDANSMPSLSKFENLLVLDLEGCNCLQNDHLKGIGDLFLLRYLAVRGNCITDIPEEIGNLVLLQTLDLRATSVDELPDSILRARQLKRVYVNSRTKIPDWIGNLSGLEELADINISKPELLEELRSLTKLIVLGIAIWSWDENYNNPLLEYLRYLFMENPNIQGLSILTCCSLDFLDNLDAGQVPALPLQKLEIRHSTFHKLPLWFSSLQKLSYLSIQVYKLSQEIIDMLGKLQNLLVLSLTSKSVPEPEARFGRCNDAFRSLTGFNFVSTSMGKIFERAAMPKLTSLKLSFQASLTNDVSPVFDFGLENLSSVEHVRVEINCFNASRKVAEDAENAIRRATKSGANLEIQRVQEEVVVENGKEEEQDMTQNGEEEEDRIPHEEVGLKQEQHKEVKKMVMGNIVLAAGKETVAATKYSISGTLTLEAL